MNTKPMRVIFGETLREIAEKYPNMVVLDADVSSSTQTKLFGQENPERFYNFGIAEANMVAVAAGMATCGLIPVVSTFAFLLALRAGDPVRSLIAYNNLNVKLAGGYAGLSDFADGASHQSICDLAVMNAMPNMIVLVPSDIESTRWAVEAAINLDKPVYLRISRGEVGSYHHSKQNFEIGKANILREGSDVTLACCGMMVKETVDAADKLAQEGIQATVLEFITLKPLDKDTLIYYANITKAVVTVEEHSIYGGLGSLISQCLSQYCPVPVRVIGINDKFGQSGTYEQLLDYYGLTAIHIVETARDILKNKERYF